MILAIDPGTSYLAWALVDGHGKLHSFGKNGTKHKTLDVQAWAAEAATWVSGYRGPEVWIEWPQIYPRSPVDPGDILRLATIAGALFGAGVSVGSVPRLVTPKQWKGSVPKHIHQARLLERLPQQWKDKLGGCTDIDILDAVGIALWAWEKDNDRT